MNHLLEQVIITEMENSANTAAAIIRNYAEYTIRHNMEIELMQAMAMISTIDQGNFSDRIEDVKALAAKNLLDRKIGAYGYFYVIDGRGTLLVHPFKELRGSNFGEYSFIQSQITKKTGFMSYKWRNPNDAEAREKVLYMDYYEPWDWIVTASAYRESLSELVHLDELRNSIKGMQQGERGYTYVMDMEGNFLIHPFYEGLNYRDLDELLDLDLSFFSDMIRNRSGHLNYLWAAQGTAGSAGEQQTVSEKMVVFKHLTELDWIIASSMYRDDFTLVLKKVNTVLVFSLFLSVLFFLALSRVLADWITRPLGALVQFIEGVKGSDYSDRIILGGRGELAKLAESFNHFLETLQEERTKRKDSEEHNRVLAQFPEENPHPVIRVDENGSILYANPMARELFLLWQIDPDGSIPDKLWDRIASLNQSFGSFEYFFSGRFYEVQISYLEMQNVFYLFLLDITDKKNTQDQLLLSESVFSNSMEGIIVTDLDGRIERVNKAFVELTGYGEDELVGGKPSLLRSGHHDNAFFKEMWDSLIGKGFWAGEIWNRRKSGEIYPSWLLINTIYDSRGEALHYVGLSRDISDLKAGEEKLRYQAYHDLLTGLPNRMLLMDRLRQAIALADRSGGSLGVMFLDLDNFKDINDSRGHNVGDQYLRAISKRIRTCCREEDTVARFGGDEFVILMPGLKKKGDAVELAYRIQGVLKEKIILGEDELHPSASIGITYYPEDGMEPELLMKNADLAMYQSKRQGKGIYSLYNAGMEEEINLRVTLGSQMRTALLDNEFCLAYQPKLTCPGGVVSGAEALIRWKHRDGHLISPADFIPLAEENGFILELGDWILKQVLHDLSLIRESGRDDFELALNLSARQFRDPELISRIKRIVSDSGLPYESLNFEITENMAMENSSAALKIVEELYNLNVKISIDDFGTGYSSLSYLKRFKTHYLKIDKSFVDELPTDSKGASLVKSIIDIGHSMGMSVIAEGVENEEQLRFLRESGCDSIQGYYYSKPLFLTEFLEYLEERR